MNRYRQSPFVLVVAADENCSSDLVSVLAGLGCIVTGVVDNGDAAIRTIETEAPQAVFFDVSAPGLQAGRIIAQRYNLPPIYICADPNCPLVDRPDLAEVLGYLIPPLEAGKLRKALDRALNQASEAERRRNIDLQRSLLEARLRRAGRLESIGFLLGGLTHRLNNIVSVVLGFAELALNDYDERLDPTPHLVEVLMSAQRAENLIRQMSVFTRSAGAGMQPISMSMAVNDAARFLKNVLPAYVDLQVKIRASEDTVEADLDLIRQLLLMLAANSVEAMTPGGGRLTLGLEPVEVGPEAGDVPADLAPGPFLRLSVADTGQGMTPAESSRAANLFYSTKDSRRGVGLGLFAAREIALRHGGGLSIISRPGQGTEIQIYFPLAPPEPDSPESTMTAAKIPRGSERIMLVDDEEGLVLYLTSALSRLGYDVVGFTSPVEAWAAFQADPDRFDLILTDQIMPEMSGINLAGEIHRLSPGKPILICTAYSADLTEAQARQAGVRKILFKPVKYSELARLIRELLDGAQ